MTYCQALIRLTSLKDIFTSAISLIQIMNKEQCNLAHIMFEKLLNSDYKYLKGNFYGGFLLIL